MAKQPDDDLFKDSVMTFGEHLEELRRCLWRAVLGIAVGFAIGIWLASDVVVAIQTPMEKALEEYYLDGAKESLLKVKPDATDKDFERIDDQRMVFESVFIQPQAVAHALGVARDKAADASPAQEEPGRENTPPEANAVPETDAQEKTEQESPAEPDAEADAESVSNSMREILIWRPIKNDSRVRMRSLAGQEAFMIWFKAAFVTGFIFASPWVFYQLWTFVAAGLYGHEKKYVYIYLPFSIGLFLFGAFMSLFVFEPVLTFFLSFNRSMGIEPEPRISEWVSFVIMLPLGFGVAFQMPLVMLFLQRIGIMTVAGYLANWRIAVMVIWVASAILTPADPYSILFLAVPLMFLYFGGIWLCKWWGGEKGGSER